MDNDIKKGDLLSLREVAEILGLKPSTIKKWAMEGRLPFPLVRFSRKAVRVQRQHVLAWINDRSAEA